MEKQRIHFITPYLCNPVHRVSVTLIGAGGKGSQMLSSLARIDSALRTLGHKGLYVTVYDPDIVEEPNLGRQLYCRAELGQNKADALVSRFNRFYGLDWTSEARAFTEKDTLGNIVVTCVDNIPSRHMVGGMFEDCRRHPTNPESCPFYWMDLGNGRNTGQVVLGSCKIEQPSSMKYSPVEKLPTVTEEFDLSSVDGRESGPSCSLAEALSKQDLFINSSLAQMAGSLLWTLLREPVLDFRGFYINLDNLKTTPIPV